ncbi:MAG: VanW family protein [Patescibacteria group bacterium]|nr:VanW family protein [Patescibacteria group bacterium]
MLIFLFISSLILEKKFSGKIYRHIYINDIEVSGLSPQEAESLLSKKIDNFNKSGFKIILKDREISWFNLSSSFEPDLVFQEVVFNINKSISSAYAISRQGNFSDYFTRIKLLFFKTKIKLDFTIQEDNILKNLQENFSDLENPAQNPRLVFREELLSDSKINVLFFIEPENSGQKINYDKFLADFNKNVSFLKNDNIYLNIINDYPDFKLEDTLGLEFEADNLLDLAPFTLRDDKSQKEFKVEFLDFAPWLYLEPQFSGDKFIEARVALDPEKVQKYLEEVVKPEVQQEAVLPRFEFQNGRVTSFESGKDGLILNLEQSFLNIKQAFDNRDMKQIYLVLDVEPIESVGNVNDLGIKEIIGTGHSNFAGSPTNRRHNIKVGASKLHGLIIKPDEEFSLVQALGVVDGSTGYLTELVIKGNKTIPEYGGGLCQIATTMFRGALATGLPITERRNHSYRVSYYEPAGTDATVYTPRPDLKFKNDTGNNILIQARFEGYNDIYFDFWGRSDGRTATTTYPVIYNIVKPGPTQIIETTDLKPGEKKCTESAHSGADAYFDYTVVYNPGLENENKVENRFYSKYVPWREVCLLGVEPKDENSTSTDSVVGEESKEEGASSTSSSTSVLSE